MDTRKIVIIVIVVAIVVAGAGLIIYQRQQAAPPESPASAPAPEIPEEYLDIANKAASLVASTLHVPVNEVTVLSVQEVTWADASLGCPESGKMYAQTLTPGYLVTTQVNGETQSVHMNDKGKGLICPPEQAQPPVETQ